MTEIAIRIHAFVTGLIADLREDKGQDLLEYAMLGGLIAAGILAVFLLFDDALENMIQGIGNCIDFNNGTDCSPELPG